MEVNIIQAVLDRVHGDFVEAYEMLLYSQERLSRKSAITPQDSNAWSGSESLVDQSKLERLYKMYGKRLDQSLVQMIYYESGKDVSRTGEMLNMLTA